MADSAMEIDDSLYSRQRYVLGDTAMHRLARSNILLQGLGGLGIEIAKNIILAGVKSLTIQDEQKVSRQDLGLQFFLREADIISNKSRAEASGQRMAELNPHVSVNILHRELTMDSDLEYLKQFQCVILTEANLDLQLRIDLFCRSQPVPIQFISADVRGVFSWSFCDFGQEFEVVDGTGEEPRDVFISDITKDNPGIVTMLENKKHGLETGDVVTFKEVSGMEVLNGMQCPITVLTPYKFSICDTSEDKFGKYITGGIAVQVKQPLITKFNSLQDEVTKPTLLFADLSKFNGPALSHLGMLAVHKFHSTTGHWPRVWNEEDAVQVVQLAHEFNKEISLMELEGDVKVEAEGLWKGMAHTWQGCLAPLCAFLGGVVAQEALKAVTGKFTPINQWLYLDAMDLVKDLDARTANGSFQPIDSRYDSLRMCIGEELCRKLGQLKLFMIGCGAIGCEMLKNYAMLGVGTSVHGGQIIVTDNDLIEMSNLNRQFLFRPCHIRKPKSTTGAESVKDINPDLNILPHQNKVGMQTEETIYSDAFFSSLDVVVNALDNVEARRYVDSRCVTNQRPLLESGTMGAKGHVQVIVPHLTESYGNQRDPVDDDVPYCTLHSFPSVIEHCIEWARDKFETLFNQQPAAFNKFWETYKNPVNAVMEIRSGKTSDGVTKASKLLTRLPQSWAECVALARVKFEKYFNHKAVHLLNAFPLDTKLQDGTLFWQSPKRPPTALTFNPSDDTHLLFVTSCAQLYADIFSVPYTRQDLEKEVVLQILPGVTIPQYKNKAKHIETDEAAKKPDTDAVTGDDVEESLNKLQEVAVKHPDPSRMIPAVFEKDDDTNGHINFISATANLRAVMYNIDKVDRLKVKRIAGRIVPAIATTTAAVAGLVTIELIKLLKSCPIEMYRNAFINLALPMFVLSEPAPTPTTLLSSGTRFSSWDRWEIKGNTEMTVQAFFEALKAKYSLDPSMVVQGSKMVYIPVIPGHKKRLPQQIINHIKTFPDKPYVDLIVSYLNMADKDGDDEMGPPVRFYYK